MSRSLRRFARGPVCLVKLSFANEATALARLAAYRRQGSPMSARRAYECPWCGSWHLTSKATPDA